MKKSIFSILCCTLLSIVAYAQIPNPGFENWTTAGAYENPDGWGTMNNTTAIDSIYTATKGTPGSPGLSYLKLTSKMIGTSVVNGIAVSGQLDSITMQPKSGFTFTSRPGNFTGRWQHMIYGSSQGSIVVTLTRWDVSLNQRITVATASKTLTGMAMSWANFSLPFVYTDSNNPDTCIIVLKASGTVPANNDYLWVDNLAFSGTAGIGDNDILAGDIHAYPVPSSNSVSFELNLASAQQITIELVDVNGKVVVSEDAGVLQGKVKRTMDVSSLSKGTYFIRVAGHSGNAIEKIIID